MLALMLLSATLSVILRPTISLADERPPIDLAVMVPTTFSEWHEEVNLTAQVVNPQQKIVIDKIYSQTLSRTYVNKQGDRVMLSIAYGKNQSDSLSLHKPEVCYPAQGFQLLHKEIITLKLMGISVNATRIETNLGNRFEPVTYWTIVGDQVVTSSINKKISELRYSIQGRVPDGMLFRISSIDRNSTSAYALQERFAKEIASVIDLKNRARFIGNKNSN
ncbi:exosortase-associated protein EpsI, B-type [Rhodoferax lithotrophicus]|uniref:exosortase-associated protein EpsI, B-type n=1 Tax=Rhodoferax lithotrophicus TaxID=2798804 RepID=UPI0021040A0E|nr:exosortase-associated protein EpsI, B-type [Rhodoferax sp. MIZ03]